MFLLDIFHDYLFSILFCVGLVAGIVDAIVGGGGLITLPALFATGMPPQIALGTNKLQAFFGTFSAALGFYQKKMYSLQTISKGVLPVLVGALLGAIATQSLSSTILSKIIPLFLLLILAYVVLAPKFGVQELPPKINDMLFYLVGGVSLGFYDGFLGPGVGSLWIFALTYFLGYNLLKASAYTKVFNLISNIVATVCFIIGGNINYKVAFFMAIGQFIGGRIGAKIALKRGLFVIRPLFITVSLCVISTLIYKNSSDSKNYFIMLGCFFTGLLLVRIIFWLKNNWNISIRLKRRASNSIQEG